MHQKVYFSHLFKFPHSAQMYFCTLLSRDEKGNESRLLTDLDIVVIIADDQQNILRIKKKKNSEEKKNCCNHGPL